MLLSRDWPREPGSEAAGGLSRLAARETGEVSPALHFPAKAARKPDDPRLAEPIGDLSIKDPQFRQWWAGTLRGVGRDKLPRAREVVPRHQDLARSAVAYSVAGACTHVRLAVIAGDSFRPQEAADRLCFHRVSDNHESHSVHQPPYLAECERVRFGAGLEEGDLERPLADHVVLAHELVKAAVPEQAVPVFVDVDAV
jgi:hypothetical protein